MKKTLLLPITLFFLTAALAQDPDAADKLVNEGVTLHDKGDYKGALAKYDKALSLDKDNLTALAEKAYTLNSLERNEEAVALCEFIVEKHAGSKDLKNVYATWGNALDILNRPDDAIEVYNAGIKQFPDFYLLYFNKGITYTVQEKYAEAMPGFKDALRLNPEHAGSHNALARIAHMGDKRIPAILAYSRFLCVEPEGGRAEQNLKNLRLLLDQGVESKGKNTQITINVNDLADTLPDGKKKEDNFAMLDMLFSISAATLEDKKFRKMNEVERFVFRMDMLFSNFGEKSKENPGFFWEYYAPYFAEMHEKKLTTTFGYIAFASSGDSEVNKWLKEHGEEITKFFEWSQAYEWK